MTSCLLLSALVIGGACEFFFKSRVWDKVPDGGALILEIGLHKFPYNAMQDKLYAKRHLNP